MIMSTIASGQHHAPPVLMEPLSTATGSRCCRRRRWKVADGPSRDGRRHRPDDGETVEIGTSSRQTFGSPSVHPLPAGHEHRSNQVAHQLDAERPLRVVHLVAPVGRRGWRCSASWSTTTGGRSRELHGEGSIRLLLRYPSSIRPSTRRPAESRSGARRPAPPRRMGRRSVEVERSGGRWGPEKHAPARTAETGAGSRCRERFHRRGRRVAPRVDGIPPRQSEHGAACARSRDVP